jgi:hypothetical protein
MLWRKLNSAEAHSIQCFFVIEEASAARKRGLRLRLRLRPERYLNQSNSLVTGMGWN